MIRQTRDKMGEITLFQTHISIFTMWDFAATFLKVKDRPAVQHTARESFSCGPPELSQLQKMLQVLDLA